MTFFADLVKDGLADKSQLERDGTQVENQFKGGKIAVWIGGPWVLGSIERTDDTNWVPAARKNVGVAPMPAGPNGDAFTFVGGSNLMMFKASKNKNEAWELMKFLSQDQVQTDYAKLLGMFPARVEPQQAYGESSGANFEAVYQAIQQGRTYSPIPQWARDRERLQGPLREHPRQRGRQGQRLQRGDGAEAARRGGQGGRRPARPGRLAGSSSGRAGRAAAPPVLSLQ